MKKTLAWFGAAFLAASLAACGGGSKPAETTPPTDTQMQMADAGMGGEMGTGMEGDTGTGNPCGASGTGTPATGNPCSTPK
jgi:hypothetical protein